MSRTLTENIERGRTAIKIARRHGLDTTQWEISLADLERQEMLAWASELAEQELIFEETVHFDEEPFRPVAIANVSDYAVWNLNSIAKTGLERHLGRWGIWTTDWWTDREHAALGALAALRKALDIRTGGR